jgi:predicted nuclease with TOPRIM domain
MSEWFDSQKQSISSISLLLQEGLDKEYPRRELTTAKTKRLAKLEAIADKLKRVENVQNRQLQKWLSEEEYEQLEYEWQEQLELRNELKDKPSCLKCYEEKLKQATSTTILQKDTAAKASTLRLRSSTTSVKAFVNMC